MAGDEGTSDSRRTRENPSRLRMVDGGGRAASQGHPRRRREARLFRKLARLASAIRRVAARVSPLSANPLPLESRGA